MEATVLPISGGKVFYQLGIIKFLSAYGYDSELWMGSSGGGIGAYVAHAADLKYDEITNVAKKLTPEMFCSEWIKPVPIASYIYGYSKKGALFNQGKGGDEFVNAYFDNINVKNREIWVGTYNSDRQTSQLFCNRSNKESLLGIFTLDPILYQLDPNIYCDGDLELISKTILASASIPGVVPPKQIFGCNHQDGGMSAASPMTFMNTLFDGYDNLHITYINCENMHSHEKSSTSGGASKEMTKTRDSVIKNIMRQDRRACYEMLSRSCGQCRHDRLPLIYESFQLTNRTWERVYDIKRKATKSLVEIYPGDRDAIDITNFNSVDVEKAIDFAENNCFCNIWYCK